MPLAFSSNIVENEDGPGPYGAKGVGEGALAGVAAAVATALADAGIHMNALPATPERIWRAMQNQDGPTAGSTGDAGANEEGGDDR
jgi:CO/xanthine dehydrogenase Mo-binding subunit